MISIPYMGKVEFLPPHYMVDIQFQFPIMGKVGSKSPFNDLFKQLFQFPIMVKVEQQFVDTLIVATIYCIVKSLA